jgi:hypothetical protein
VEVVQKEKERKREREREREREDNLLMVGRFSGDSTVEVVKSTSTRDGNSYSMRPIHFTGQVIIAKIFENTTPRCNLIRVTVRLLGLGLELTKG